MAKKPGIPSVALQDQQLNTVVNAIKENIEILTGSRVGVGEIRTLGTSATNDEIVAKLNEVIKRLNVSGN
jgi:hypothetical protein